MIYGGPPANDEAKKMVLPKHAIGAGTLRHIRVIVPAQFSFLRQTVSYAPSFAERDPSYTDSINQCRSSSRIVRFLCRDVAPVEKLELEGDLFSRTDSYLGGTFQQI